MKLTVLGCAGSYPGPDSPCSSYLVEADGFRLLLDLGSGAFGALQRHADPRRVDAVLLSHLHYDHWIDLTGYSVFRGYHPDGPLPALPVHGPSDIAEAVGTVFDGPPAEFALHPVAPGSLDVGPFRLRLQRVNHPVETYGMRIEHGGRVLTYSADTGACDALVDLARDADVLLCEASYVSGTQNSADVHLTGAQAGEHATRAGAHRLLLTHLVAWNDDEQVREEAAGTYAGDLTLVRSGDSYDI